MATRSAPARPDPKKLSHLRKPADLSLRQWQAALRRQAGALGKFQIRNLTDRPVFSEFLVRSDGAPRAYRVAIRGDGLGLNYCACPDYAVNTLGTCKHIEAVLGKLRRTHAAALARGYQPPYSEIYVAYGARRVVRFAAGTLCPPAVRRAAAAAFDADGSLRPGCLGEVDALLRAARAAGHELRAYDDALALLAEQRDGASRQSRLAARYGGRGADAAWKSLLKVELFPYQRAGALFAAKAGRALIADEMGLGKTIQAIAAAELLARDSGVERALVICPTSLKCQWKQEIEKFSGRPTLIVEGTAAARRALYRESGPFFNIANYDVVHRDLDGIAAWSPDLVILDEAQRIKNWQTIAARAVKRIQSRFAIVLTGTPLENRLEELHSIVEFVDRFRLGPLFAFRHEHAITEGPTGKVVGYRGLERINRTLAPILIRRTKKEVLSQLPERMDKNFFVPMTPPQTDYHEESRVAVGRLVEKWRRTGFLTESEQLRLRIELQNMRMVCDSTYLLDQETRHGRKVDELGRLLEEIFENRDQKVVIFSQWVRMNELVAEMLDARRWGHVHLHGAVPGPKRRDLVRALHEDDDCRVFLSTDAGGVGLNLQRAATVVNMDLPWNPAVLEQRIARVHRLGQKRPVRVVNFIAENTIEHGMLALLSFKRSVFQGVLDGAADEVFMGESALARFMKTVARATESVPVATPGAAADEDAAAREGAQVPRSANGDAGGERILSIAAAPAGAIAGGAVVPAAPTESAPRAEAPAADRGRPGTSPFEGGAGATALSALLARGAELLGALAGGLSVDGGRAACRDASQGPPASPGVRVETDPRTGRRELRVALPEERVLIELGERIVGLIEGLARR